MPTPSPRATPAGTPTPGATAAPRTYVVRAGDTLQAIANRFGISVKALSAANGISNPNLITSGQVLVIP